MKTLNTIYLWLMLAACVLALAGCVEEKVSGTGEGGNISVKMNVNARGGSDIQAEMENAVKSLRVYAFIGQKQIGYYRGTTGLNPDERKEKSDWMDTIHRDARYGDAHASDHRVPFLSPAVLPPKWKSAFWL